MPSFWDLLPASAWPVQPFIPPPDPVQPAAWPFAASVWTPAVPSPVSWLTAAGDIPADADSSVSEWDRAMRQALAAQSSAARDPGFGGTGVTDQMVADAKRALDFVRWVFPPSASQAPPMGDAMLRGGSQYVGATPRNVAAASAAALPSSIPQADDVNAPPRPLAGADQQPDLGAAFSNPNIERQGARARAIAAMRPPPAPAIGGQANRATVVAGTTLCQLPDGRIVPYVTFGDGLAFITGDGGYPSELGTGAAPGNAVNRADMPTVDKFGGIAGGGRSGPVTSPASSLLRDMTGRKVWAPLRPLTRAPSIGGSLARGLRLGGAIRMTIDAASLLNAMQNAPICRPIA